MTVLGLVLIDFIEWFEETELGVVTTAKLQNMIDKPLVTMSKICGKRREFQEQINEENENVESPEENAAKSVEIEPKSTIQLKSLLISLYIPIYVSSLFLLFDI